MDTKTVVSPDGILRIPRQDFLHYAEGKTLIDVSFNSGLYGVSKYTDDFANIMSLVLRDRHSQDVTEIYITCLTKEMEGWADCAPSDFEILVVLPEKQRKELLQNRVDGWVYE